MKAHTLIAVIVGIGIIGAVAYGMNVSQTDTSTARESEMMMEAESMAGDGMEEVSMEMKSEETTDTMMKDEMGSESMMKDKMSSGAYVTYSAEAVAAQPADAKTVLFFKASWCPSCRALDADIKANLESIPSGVTIMEVDYDTNTELRRKYGVTTQHTLVQVDNRGELITKNSGALNLEAVVAQLQ